MTVPYRTLAEIANEIPRRSKWKDPDWVLYRVTFGFIFSFTVLSIVAGVRECSQPPPPPKPCSYYADWASQNVPARCTKTFDGEKP